MKKLSRLVNYKTKQMKNVKTYNPFDTGDNNVNGNDEMSHTTKFNKTIKSHNNKMQLEQQTREPILLQNCNKTNENATIANSTKTKAKGNKFIMSTLAKTKNKSKPTKTMSSSSLSTSSSSSARTAFKSGNVTSTSNSGGSNSINYASLDRMRNSSCNSTPTIKRKWPYLWWKRYGRHRKPKSWRLKNKHSCWRHLKKMFSCCHSSKSTSSYQYNTDEDDDIDAKFNAYIIELKARDARELEKEEQEKQKQLQLAHQLNANSSSSGSNKMGNDNSIRKLPTISMTRTQVNINTTNHATNSAIKTPTCHKAPTQKKQLETSNTTKNTFTLNATTPTTTTTTSTNLNRVSFAGLPPRSNQNLSKNTNNTNTTTLQRRHS